MTKTSELLIIADQPGQLVTKAPLEKKFLKNAPNSTILIFSSLDCIIAPARLAGVDVEECDDYDLTHFCYG